MRRREPLFLSDWRLPVIQIPDIYLIDRYTACQGQEQSDASVYPEALKQLQMHFNIVKARQGFYFMREIENAAGESAGVI